MASTDIKLPRLANDFRGQLVLRFDFSRSRLHAVTVRDADGEVVANGVPGEPAADPSRIHPDPYSVVLSTTNGSWRAGDYRIEVDFEGEPPTLNRLHGATWRMRVAIDTQDPGGSVLLVSEHATAARVVASRGADDVASTAFYAPIGRRPSQELVVPIPERPEPWPTGSTFAELEFETPPASLDKHPRVGAPQTGDPSVDYEDSKPFFVAMQDFRRDGIEAVDEKRLLIPSAKRAEEIREGMEFFVGVDAATHPSNSELSEHDHAVIDAGKKFFFGRIKHRVFEHAPPDELGCQQIEDLRAVVLGSLESSSAQRAQRQPPDMNRLFGDFACGQLTPYAFVDRPPDLSESEFYRFRTGGVPNGSFYLLFGEAARYFYELDQGEDWFELFKTFTWTAELALHFAWDGASRGSLSYAPEYVVYEDQPRPFFWRYVLREQRRKAFERNASRREFVNEKFDAICAVALSDLKRQSPEDEELL